MLGDSKAQWVAVSTFRARGRRDISPRMRKAAAIVCALFALALTASAQSKETYCTDAPNAFPCVGATYPTREAGGSGISTGSRYAGVTTAHALFARALSYATHSRQEQPSMCSKGRVADAARRDVGIGFTIGSVTSGRVSLTSTRAKSHQPNLCHRSNISKV
jgi:hypothetical protein